jgi:nitroreductase
LTSGIIVVGRSLLDRSTGKKGGGKPMDAAEAIKSRKSIRGYKTTPVPKEILTKILEAAIRAPSTGNSQPWEFVILSGKAMDDFKRAVEEAALSGIEPRADFQTPRYTGVYRERHVAISIALYQLMDIAREDKDKRLRWMLRMARGFEAPNAIIVLMDEETNNAPSLLAIGALSQNIALMAMNFGLGTCMNEALVSFPGVVRQLFSIPESKKLVVGISIGYPDWDFPANKLQTPREPLENILTWHGV